MGRLDVRIVQARNIPNTGVVVGKVSSYCLVEIEDTQHRTSTVPSTTSPLFDQVFKFIIADPSSAQLKITIWGKHTISDSFLGQYKMSLSGLVKGQLKEQWVLLQ